ncbi:radical SAM protein [Sorangium cellulosum]|uniref:Radical SAM protein n=1 Tax=Sorangium cellulosum TaxID=56 RepID=A0A150TAH0_SORCE|nr:radical SAM protein [Sorangium cellulosum]
MIEPTEIPVRALMPADLMEAKPIYAVWELTMKCDQPCQHCGSRAGAARDAELSTEEVLEVAASLARLGCREVALIGGEAYLREDLAEIVSFLARSGMRVIMQTGGRAFTAERAKALRAAGLTGLGVSVDGPAHIHDELRGNVGSHAAAIRALDNARGAGLITTANTQINRLNAHLLRETCAELRSHGIQTWQVQITVPMGRAADHPEWILEPWRVVEVIDTLAAIQREALETHVSGVPFNVFANNNIGYFGPHEQLLRSRPGGGDAHWRGCRGGINAIGIESDGTVKACPSVPTVPYAGGNVRERGLEHIWEGSAEVRFARDRDASELWGHCATCYYADECRAGCSWTAHCTLGRRGNNPFCYHRVTQLKRRGIRERLVMKQRAPHVPYDHGVFELVEEAWDAPPPPPPEPVVPRNARRRLAVI